MFPCLNGGTAGGGLPMDQFVPLAAQGGFAGADVDMGYALTQGTSKLAHLFSSHGLKLGGWGPPDVLRCEPATIRDNLERLKKLAPIARELRIDSCSTWIMPSSKLPFLENFKYHIDRLQPAANILADNGLRLGLEFVAPHHLRRMARHEFIFTPGLMLELTEAIGPNVGLLVDSFHCHTGGVTWEHLSKIPAAKIVLAHLNDAPSVPIAELLDGNRLLPGQGSIDLTGFLSALKQAGYGGPVSVEVFNANLRKLPPATAARRAAEATKNVFQAAGLL